jgi:hypothetical protein
VAKAEVICQFFREDKSGMVMVTKRIFPLKNTQMFRAKSYENKQDRRKNLRQFKQCFVAVEAVNLIMRKLKVGRR